MIRLFAILFSIFIFCDIKKEPKVSAYLLKVESTDIFLHCKNGIWYYKNKLFFGMITERYSNQVVHHMTSYLDGKEQGWQQSFFEDGKIEEKRFYRNGEKDGVHTGWWQNGKLRFEYHFKNGSYNGNYTEWYITGDLLKQIHYTNGADDSGKGWRQNGKLYMNFIVKEGRRYGLNNSNLCYTIKNGNGEYVSSRREENSK